MIKIQDVLLKKPIIDISRHMFYRSATKLEMIDDNSVKLYRNNYYDFFTFNNALSAGLFFRYTNVKKFYLVLDIKGDFRLELFGHLSKKENYQKEWLGTHTYKYVTRKKLIIPITTQLSDIISFGLWCFDDTFIYDAYYAADVDEEQMNDARIHIVSGFKTNDAALAEKSNRLIKNILSSDNTFNQNFSFNSLVSDSLDIASFDLSDIPKNTTNVIVTNGVIVSEESLSRSYIFLRLLKKEYLKSCISGAVIDLMRPNVRILEVPNTEDDEDGKKAEKVTYRYLDLNDFVGVVENECSKSLTSSILDINSFICLPVSMLKERDVIKKVLNSKIIYLNGITAYGSEVVQKSRKNQKKNKIRKDTTYKLQDILFDTEKSIEVTRHMYYRSEGIIERVKNGDIRLPAGRLYDFFTYFNAFSIEKWKKYTHINDLFLVLEVKGSFDIDLFGHYKNKTGYQKEYCGKYSFSKEEKELIVIKFPRGLQSSLVSFAIYAHSDLHVSKAYYSTDVDLSKIRTPLISMVTTTFKKEDYVQKNIELLSENLLNNDDYKNHFIWNIIDNGCTFEPIGKVSKKIRIFKNRNVGGAGGFARGMMESLLQKEKPDYILLMDDDVVFIPESFKRLYILLSMLKDEYKNHFISGAMLKMGQPNIQHEDTGKLIPDGYHVAVKPNYDLNLWDHIIDNEVIIENVDHQYGAWWFCCIPTTVASLDNLPVPVFVRGDDVEYSLRNNAKFITMNGLCIWHEDFEGKFSAALEFYQVNRNELAVRAMHPELKDVDCIGHIKTIFWEEIYKFNYTGASLLLDAIADYMKGPEFYKKLDGEKSMKKKRQKDYKMLPITPDIEAKIDFDTLYEYVSIPGKQKTIYDYTYNGQARIPEAFIKNKTGVIPYGWGYSPGKMCLTKQNIAVDQTNQTYVVYKKNRKKFEQLKARYESVLSRYNLEHKRIEKLYQNSMTEITSEDFWRRYLKL